MGWEQQKVHCAAGSAEEEAREGSSEEQPEATGPARCHLHDCILAVDDGDGSQPPPSRRLPFERHQTESEAAVICLTQRSQREREREKRTWNTFHP